MPIQVTCPGCAAEFKIADKHAGKRGKCPKCSGEITVPAVAETSAAQGRLAAGSMPLPQQMDPTQTPPPPRTADGLGRVSSQRPSPAGPPGNLPPATAEIIRQKIAKSFQGDIERTHPTITYKIGVFLVMCVLITLPLVYLALVALVAYAVYYHAVHHTGLMAVTSGRAQIFMLLVYLAPMIIGPISILFMIKPIFARPAQEGRTRSLTRQGEPLLFAFVEQLCQKVGAPMPSRIDVDYDLNASASFRRGMLSFFGSDLVLTIGVPLAAGLTLRQFTGVLAHEFGHFSQGTGMRITYVARSINFWFARVVYQRDQWDEFLAVAASSLDIRVGWILLLSQLFVTISRGVLWLLMCFGHAVSGYMLREMEYDADRYEARIAGSETFAETSLRMRELAAGYQLTQQTVMEQIERGTFPDDLAGTVKWHVNRLPDTALRDIRKSVQGESTGLFDSHPADKDRITNALKEAAPGIFQVKGPASALFSDFETLSKNVTWDLYRAMGAEIAPKDMTPIDSLLKDPDPEQPEAPNQQYHEERIPLD